MKEVDFKKLAIIYLPIWLRSSTLICLIYAAIIPFTRLFNLLQNYYEKKVYRLTHNGQVCYLEAVLRDAFDPTLRRIWIGDFASKNRIYFWPESDRRDVNFGEDQYFFEDSDYADSGIDFTINIPNDIALSDTQMAYLRSLTDEYKLAGKQYNIARF